MCANGSIGLEKQGGAFPIESSVRLSLWTYMDVCTSRGCLDGIPFFLFYFFWHNVGWMGKKKQERTPGAHPWLIDRNRLVIRHDANKQVKLSDLGKVHFER